jgi:hypothetical protein
VLVELMGFPLVFLHLPVLVVAMLPHDVPG